jgi:hypothetical protein
VIATGNIQLLPLQIHEINNLVFRKNLPVSNPNPSCGDRKGFSSIALLNRCDHFKPGAHTEGGIQEMLEESLRTTAASCKCIRASNYCFMHK